jgi:hypothetical protein
LCLTSHINEINTAGPPKQRKVLFVQKAENIYACI